MTTLNVRWEPAEGRVKEYKVVYAPAAGGPEMVVGAGGPASSSEPPGAQSCWRAANVSF